MAVSELLKVQELDSATEIFDLCQSVLEIVLKNDTSYLIVMT